METLPDRGVISISIEHDDAGVREIYFDQFEELREMLSSALGEEWEWQQDELRIYKELPGKSFLNKDDWPELISFLKERIIALDAFWESGKYVFEGLK